MNHRVVLSSRPGLGVQTRRAASPGRAARVTGRERRQPLRARTTEGYRAALESEAWKLRLALESAEAVELPIVADPIDSSSLEHERHMALDSRRRKAVLLAEVNAALQRIRIGTYGLCAECGEPISPGRLNALPWARLCLKCQQEQEAGNRFAADDGGLTGEPVEAA